MKLDQLSGRSSVHAFLPVSFAGARKLFSRIRCWYLLAALVPAVLAFAQNSKSGDAVLQHLNQAISWYRNLESLVQSTPAPGAAPARDDAKDQSLDALRNAFDYARAQAATLAPDNQDSAQPAAGTSSKTKLQRAYTLRSQRIAAIQDQLTASSEALNKANAKTRPDLLSQRDVLQGELKLNQNVQQTLKKLLEFVTSNGDPGGAAGLLGHISDLEQTVPEIRQDTQKQAKSPTSSNSQVFHADSEGIVGLGLEIFTLVRGRLQVDKQINATDELLNSMAGLRKQLRARLQSLLQQTEQLTPQAGANATEQRAKMRQELNSLGLALSQTSNAMLPLGKEAILLESARSSLSEWTTGIQREYKTALRYLLFRFAEIAVVIVLILLVSAVWQRLTVRYVRDARLRRQMLLIRRFVMGFAITLAVILSFVTEFGSFATFAGFITAGIAVALQNLILSVVAYFFLIGRYGVRVGDRVTISGVTGEVVELGLVRVYLMELSGGGTDFRPTGRIVVFSNSVLFQPSALFKQLPGTEYAWHTASVTLAPDVELEPAETRLMAAVESVYSKYRSAIQRQHATFERSVNLQVAEPAPERYVKYTDAGLELSIRYPVEMRRAAEIDELMMKTLLAEVAKEPKIHSSGSLKIQAVV